MQTWLNYSEVSKMVSETIPAIKELLTDGWFKTAHTSENLISRASVDEFINGQRSRPTESLAAQEGNKKALQRKKDEELAKAKQAEERAVADEYRNLEIELRNLYKG